MLPCTLLVRVFGGADVLVMKATISRRILMLDDIIVRFWVMQGEVTWQTGIEHCTTINR